MPPEIAKLLDLIDQYGLAIVVAVVVSVALLYLFKLYKAGWEARLLAESNRADYIEKLRLEERAGRLDVEGRLASNSETLREATAVFAASQQFQQQLVEKLVERDSAPRGRRSG